MTGSYNVNHTGPLRIKNLIWFLTDDSSESPDDLCEFAEYYDDDYLAEYSKKFSIFTEEYRKVCNFTPPLIYINYITYLLYLNYFWKIFPQIRIPTIKYHQLKCSWYWLQQYTLIFLFC